MSGIDDELAKRLAALRSSRAKPTAPSDDSATARLSALDPPTDEEAAHSVPIATKNVDDEVARYLSLASASTPSTIPPPSNDRHLNAALNSLESAAPAFASPIEVSFAGPPPPGSVALRTDDEDAALIRRLQDELSVEESVRRRGGGGEEGGIEGLEERLRKVKEFRSVDGSGRRDVKDEEKEQADLGQAPGAVELEEFEKARARRRGRDSDDDSESEESEESKDSEDEDSEED
ncbi:hypothetical protein BCR35DRAFT_303516 [Leucosporidium creatinivorum]|uniref:Uncharacterized protein n=1 Tax=Leucosporidium creatinivorum TaxID=106004 RepID=A0A1Y2FHM5_9BASI|nr:hypothetical protein BCR35DRAFT_303516 [Leucosporidium creatinivorum]